MQIFRKTFQHIVIFLVFGFFSEALAGEFKDNPFQPSEDIMADVDAVLDKAAEEGKLSLIVMGAEWCHDSMGLYRHFQDPELAATLAENYQILFIDVGYLEKGQEVIQRFGQPVIYGTPTVLVIDPKTERLLNGETMHRLRDSNSMSAGEARAYFANAANPAGKALSGAPPSGELKALYDEIDAFEEHQATRIYRAFAFIGPRLEAYENGADDGSFMAYWDELKSLRYAITGDLARLRNDAKARIAAGEENIQLDFPEYPAFSWE